MYKYKIPDIVLFKKSLFFSLFHKIYILKFELNTNFLFRNFAHSYYNLATHENTNTVP